MSFFILQPKVVTDIEDEELKTQMEELRVMNQEVAGDDDFSDEHENFDTGEDNSSPAVTTDTA